MGIANFIALVSESFNWWDRCEWKPIHRTLCLVELRVSNDPLQRQTENAFFSVLIKIHAILSSYSTTELQKAVAKLQTTNNAKWKFQNILYEANIHEL